MNKTDVHELDWERNFGAVLILGREAEYRDVSWAGSQYTVFESARKCSFYRSQRLLELLVHSVSGSLYWWKGI